MKKIVFCENAPKPIGPYSQAIWSGDFLFISGQIPIDPQNGEVGGKNIEHQATIALTNLINILKSEGLNTESLVKTTVFLKNISDFETFNKVYEKMMDGACPARSVVEVAGLPRGVLIEIEAIACR
ncbi:MAG: Rid family detoxifying hydrolase [Chitinispirillaceae bacterium]|nr:Rid family detoxifying hydrolase [Chitinispirillaceae bacterium]